MRTGRCRCRPVPAGRSCNCSATSGEATFTGPKPATWWTRRRLHETAVHRADAAIALGAPYELPAELAADGISEWLERLADQHLTDNTWTIVGGVHRHGQPASADLTVSGPATGLLLALLRRQPAEDIGISVQGDHALWHSWLALTPL